MAPPCRPHLDELEPAYWQAHLKVDRPTPAQVLELLSLRSRGSDDDDNLATLDFGLPGEASNYVLCVRFNEDGEVGEISMES